MRYISRVKRYCKCGCGQSFKCRPKSKRRFINFHQNIGRKYSKKLKKILSLQKMGNKNPRYGKHPWNYKTKGICKAWNRGKKWSLKTLKKLSESHKGYVMPEAQKRKIGQPLEKHWNWQGGKSYKPYSLLFDSELKEKIRQRDDYQCQNKECNMTEEEHLIVYGYVLSIHHIDYDKKNCKEDNLISLCLQCNSRANFNKNLWIKQYRSITSDVVAR